jgi:enoyl-CoA hydratase/carnithine racemase
LIGRTAATQLLLTAERVPASQALTLGLVDELAPSPDLVQAAAHRALARMHMQGNWKLENGERLSSPALHVSNNPAGFK